MAQTIPPIPYKTPMITQAGMLTEPWSKFFRQLFQRVGGLSALSNIELAGGENAESNTILSLATRVADLESEIDGLKQEPV